VLGVDRTSMVALLGTLERKGIIAQSRYSETERDFTATVGDAGAAGLRQALQTVLSDNGHT
jgi:DNA-binding MarR family transcriptional regulator